MEKRYKAKSRYLTRAVHSNAVKMKIENREEY
jgi:hypothetical protein